MRIVFDCFNLKVFERFKIVESIVVFSSSVHELSLVKSLSSDGLESRSFRGEGKSFEIFGFKTGTKLWMLFKVKAFRHWWYLYKN